MTLGAAARIPAASARDEAPDDVVADVGAAALLLVTLAAAAMAVVGVVVVVAAVAGSAGARLQTAADLAALAAVSASPLAGGPDVDGRGVARERAVQVATANGADVTGIDVSGWPVEVAVEVRLSVSRVGVPWPWATPRATAAAALRPRDDG